MDTQHESSAYEGLEARLSILSLNPISPANSQFFPFFQLLFSNLPHQEVEGLRGIRQIISVEGNPPLLELVQTNVLPKLIEMAYSRSKDFIFELCWILCNIGSGCSKCSSYLLEIKALDFLNHVLDIDPYSFDFKHQIIIAIGNFAGESAEFRNIVLESPIFAKVLQYADRFSLGDDDKSENLVWAMSNLARNRPPAPAQMLKVLDRYFIDFVLKSKTVSMLKNSCWGLAYTTEVRESTDDFPIFLLSKLIKLTNHEDSLIAVPAIISIGNLISISDSIWKNLKHFNAVEYLINNFIMTKQKLEEKLFGHYRTFVRIAGTLLIR
jgi:hypothetical protein